MMLPLVLIALVGQHSLLAQSTCSSNDMATCPTRRNKLLVPEDEVELLQTQVKVHEYSRGGKTSANTSAIEVMTMYRIIQASDVPQDDFDPWTLANANAGDPCGVMTYMCNGAGGTSGLLMQFTVHYRTPIGAYVFMNKGEPDWGVGSPVPARLKQVGAKPLHAGVAGCGFFSFPAESKCASLEGLTEDSECSWFAEIVKIADTKSRPFNFQSWFRPLSDLHGQESGGDFAAANTAAKEKFVAGYRKAKNLITTEDAHVEHAPFGKDGEVMYGAEMNKASDVKQQQAG